MALIPGMQWDDLQVTINNVATGAAAASWVDFFGGKVLDVRDSDVIYFNMQIPHATILGGDTEIHMHYVLLDAPAVGDTLQIDLTYSWAGLGQAFTGPVSVPTVTKTFDVTSAVNTMYYMDLAHVAGSVAKGISSILVCSLRVNAAGTYGTAGKRVGILYCDGHTLRDGLGSNKEHTKI